MAYTQLTEIERYQIFSLKEAGFTPGREHTILAAFCRLLFLKKQL
ncbi:hypothetical protein [Xenorhabdus ishibashii]|uniref:Transposase n=1 Tax=Xenorhabdus ishibashii TaxID=1034471 RepID=A0A2D0KBV6_9GAMM|nr:hypothetical protein [Xenorhabdus ishibashii]PHM60959.1 transposase [Xenorhabdus ishibashii]